MALTRIPLDDEIAIESPTTSPRPAQQLTQDQVLQIAQEEGADPSMMLALWQQESSSGKNAKTSTDGARGAFQMMPATFSGVMKGQGRIDDPFDNARAAARLQATHQKSFPDRPDQQAAAYFTGEGNVRRAGGAIPNTKDGNGKDTPGYVSDVLRMYASGQAPKPLKRIPLTEDAPVEIAPVDQDPVATAYRESNRFKRIPLTETEVPVEAAPPKTPLQPTVGSVFKDSVVAIGKSVPGLSGALYGAVNALTLGGMDAVGGLVMDETMTEKFRRTDEMMGEYYSDAFKEKQKELQKVSSDEDGGFFPAFGYVLSNPSFAIPLLLESTGFSLGVGAVARKTAQFASSNALQAATKAGKPIEEATKLAQLAGQKAAERGVIAANSTLEGGSANQDAISLVGKMSHEDLYAKSEDYRSLVDSGVSKEQAKERIAQLAGSRAAFIHGFAAGSITKFTGAGKFEGSLANMFGGKGAAPIKAIKGVVSETVEEGLQGASNRLAINDAIQTYANKDQSLTQGVAGDAGAGAASGLLFGAGGAALSAIGAPPTDLVPTPTAVPLQPPLDVAGQNASAPPAQPLPTGAVLPRTNEIDSVTESLAGKPLSDVEPTYIAGQGAILPPLRGNPNATYVRDGIQAPVRIDSYAGIGPDGRGYVNVVDQSGQPSFVPLSEITNTDRSTVARLRAEITAYKGNKNSKPAETQTTNAATTPPTGAADSLTTPASVAPVPATQPEIEQEEVRNTPLIPGARARAEARVLANIDNAAPDEQDVAVQSGFAKINAKGKAVLLPAGRRRIVELKEASSKPDSLVKTKTLYGGTVHVKQADIDRGRDQLPIYTANGDRKGGTVHRDNLDYTGEKLAALHKENESNPFFDVITSKSGAAFANRAAAQRKLNAEGLANTHEIAPASEIKQGADGFVLRKKVDNDAIAEREAIMAVAETALDNVSDARIDALIDATFNSQQTQGVLTDDEIDAAFGLESTPASSSGAQETDAQGADASADEGGSQAGDAEGQSGLKVDNQVDNKPDKQGEAVDNKAPESALFQALRSVGIDPNAPVDKAKQLRREADKLMRESSAMIDRIPAGQPVQSTRDRNFREKSLEKARKASDLYKQAEALESTPQVNETAPSLTKPEAKKKEYGSKNKIFTKDAADRARELLKKKLGQVNAGIDPEILTAGMTLAGYHIEAGANSFAAYSKAMINDLGEGIRPYLRSFYEAVRNYPGVNAAGMTDAAEIEQGALDKSSKVAMEQPNSEWSKFHPDTGTLGIPRAEMPQVPVRMRADLFTFLDERGITHHRADVAADSLKPTQAEFSTVKTKRAKGMADDSSDMSAVLVSSDGYVLDGHHRWLAKSEAHLPINVIEFDAPIKELIAAVREFPGARTSPTIETTVAMLHGVPYNYDRQTGDNYKPSLPGAFLSDTMLEDADAYIEKYYKDVAVTLSPEERARAESLLAPKMKLAEAAKTEYDQKIIDITERTHSLGQMLAPIKGMGRASEKLVKDEKFNVDGMKDLLRSTIVVRSYADAQKVLDEIAKEFTLTRTPKNRTETDLRDLPAVGRDLTGGYSDILVNVKMENGTIAEIQINVPEMLSIKEYKGHKLYEAARIQVEGGALYLEIYRAMRGIYDATFSVQARAVAADFKNADSAASPDTTGVYPLEGKASRGSSDAPSSASLNTSPSGNSTQSSPPESDKNEQPSGNLSGSFIFTSDESVPENANKVYDEVSEGDGNERGNGKNGAGGDAGKGTATAGTAKVKRKSGGVRQKPDGRSVVRNRLPLNDDRQEAGLRQDGGLPEAGGDTQLGNASGAGDRAVRDAGVPVGRDIPAKSGLNYHFTDADLDYKGSWITKAGQNVRAIELVKQLETEGRKATRAEQAILAKFIGWGASDIRNKIFDKNLDAQLDLLSKYEEAIANLGDKPYLTNSSYSAYSPAFHVVNAKNPGKSWYTMGNITRAMLDESKPDASWQKWGELRDRLKAVMTDNEWKTAERSTQYAHYTGKEVVNELWRALDLFGFKGGAILEPGAGNGIFPGLMSAELSNNSIYTGIEYDALTGAILKHLQPDERILTESFVDSALPDGFYDVAIGNPPFSDAKILSDPRYKKYAFALHDYFFAKTMDLVKPGGIVIFITSRYTMDKQNDKARQYLAERADLLGAIRLPETAFKKNAGTEVVTDVLFLRKKVAGETFEGNDWMGVTKIDVKGGEHLINEYFAKNPNMVLGVGAIDKNGMYAENTYTVLPNKDTPIEQQLAAAVDLLPREVYRPNIGTSAQAAQVREIDWNPKAKKEGNYYVSDSGQLMQVENRAGVPATVNKSDEAMVKSFVTLRDAVNQSQYDQLNNGDWEASLKALQKTYKDFVKKHGNILQNKVYERTIKTVDENTGEEGEDVVTSRRFAMDSKLNDDPDYTKVRALENIDDESGKITPSDWLTKRTLEKEKAATISTPHDALLSSLNDLGRVDVPLIAQRMGLSERATIEALGTAIYNSPSTGWEMADSYLSGDVKKKLKEAQEAAKADRKFERNVAALLEAQPSPVPPSDITASIGMNWIPAATYEQFLEEKAGVKARVIYNEHIGTWTVQAISGERSGASTQDWGTPKRNAADILEAGLTGRQIRITETAGSGKDKTTQFDAPGTEAANQKLKEMRAAFREWLWQDGKRSDELVRVYNDKFNTTVSRKFDGSHLTLPGSTTTISVFDHVKRGAWRIIQTGNTYLAHAVGAGKTWAMVISAMEQKRLGLINKPMMVVPNHMLQQFAQEWMQLYPAARLMVADEKQFHTDNRRRFVARAAMSDLDGIIITHSAFKLLDIDPDFKAKMIQEQLDYLEAALKDVQDAEGDTASGGGFKKSSAQAKSRNPKVREIQNRIEKMEEKLKASMSGEGKDKSVRFDEMGVDQIYVDEAHEFRKLAFTTVRQVKGIDSSGSERAFDLYIKSRWLEEKHPGRSMVMASGTPITNTLAEIFTVQRFMQPDVLEERGLHEFDAWASMFGEESTEIEADASGKYSPVTRFANFVNVPELTQMFRNFADVLTSDHLAEMLGDKRPKVAGGSRKLVVTPQVKEYMVFKEELAQRLKISKEWKPSRDQPNNPDPVIAIIGDGRLAAIDMRFMDPSLPSNPASKLNQVIDGVIKDYKASSDKEYVGKDGKAEPNKGAAQMVFANLGFGAGVAAHRGFSARKWFEKRMQAAGIPSSHVAFMSDYKKSADKVKLFREVNSGKVRILVGSAKNMGTGVNAQQRLLDMHLLDTPWYPADLEQQEGRIIRQGNKNPLVNIYAYSTKGSYDTNMWQLLARKQGFINQALSGDKSVRRMEDISEVSQFQMATAMTAGDQRAIKLAGLNAEIDRYDRLYRAHEENRQNNRHAYNVAGNYIDLTEKMLAGADKMADRVQDLSGDKFAAKVGKKEFTARKEWGEALLAKMKDANAHAFEGRDNVGEISGFPVELLGRISRKSMPVWQNAEDTESPRFKDVVSYESKLRIKLEGYNEIVLAQSESEDPVGMAMRANNALTMLARAPAEMRRGIEEAKAKRNAIEGRLDAKFQFAEEYSSKQREAAALEAEMLAPPRSFTYNRDDFANATTMYSRTAASTTGIAHRDAQAIVRTFESVNKNAPRIHVHEDVSKAPKALLADIQEAGAENDVEGAYHNGEIHLFPQNIQSLDRLVHVLTHEGRHFAFQGMHGKAMDSVLLNIYQSNDAVRAQADAKRQKLNIESVSEATEEVLADMQADALAKLKGWARLKTVIRLQMRQFAAALRRAGFDAIGKALQDKIGAWTDNDIAGMVRNADKFVRSGSGGNSYGVTRFMTAYHGSPHDFDKFSTENIGTGEGAQAYGHGLYFAGNKEVAEYYKDALSKNSPLWYFVVDGKSIGQGSADFQAADIAYTMQKYGPVENGWLNREIGARGLGASDTKKRVDRILSSQIERKKGGRLYSVELAPAETDYLLWDKPLSEQSEKVKLALRNGVASMKDQYDREYVGRSLKDESGVGGYIYKVFASLHNDEGNGTNAGNPSMRKASEYLHSIGIRGIKYLDGSSRDKGDGSFNYVVFDDNDVSITAKFSRSYLQDLQAELTSKQPSSTKFSRAAVLDSAASWTASHFVNDKSLSPWMRTVGTQYHKAVTLEKQGMPHFKRVFDKGQEFLADISAFAIRAEQRAPNMFKRMQGAGDFLKGGVNRKDVAAISNPLFDGTLNEKRVFTDAELRQTYRLTPAQITMYREALAAANQSLDDVAKALIAKHAQVNGIPYDRDMSLSDMADAVGEQSNDADLLKKIRDIAAKPAQLAAEGYFPLSRFGDHTVTMTGADGTTQFFGLYESQNEANKVAAALREDSPKSAVETGIMSKQAFKLYGGLNLDALQLFANEMDVHDTPLYQEYLRSAVNNRSVLKRLIHRKGTPGFSTDVERTLAQFITSNARHASTQYNLYQMREAAEAVPKQYGDVKDEAIRLWEYVSQPVEEAQKLRSFLFFQFLGGSVASAMVNLTQVPMMTAPYLSQYANAGKLLKAITAASKMALLNPAKATGALGVALRRAEESGVTAPQEIHQLMATASNSLFTANHKWNAALKMWGGMFSMAEVFNRRTTFIAAFNIAKDRGDSDAKAFVFAENAVHETQGIYNKANRPNWARGYIGSVVFTFKQYSIMYVELFKRLPPKQQMIMLGILILASGLEGLPFEEDLLDLIDTLGQWLGFATNSKRWVRETAVEALGEKGAHIALNGISAVLPIDLQGRMGMHNLIPGSAALKQSEINKGRDVQEFVGPIGSVIASAADALQNLAKGNFSRAAMDIAPRAVQNAFAGGGMLGTGEAKDKTGKKVADVSFTEALGKTIGFNPAKLANLSEKKRALIQDRNLLRVKEDGIVSGWANGIIQNKPGEIADAKKALADWNRNNPDMKIVVSASQIRSRVRAARIASDVRFIKSLPREQRVRARAELDGDN